MSRHLNSEEGDDLRELFQMETVMTTTEDDTEQRDRLIKVKPTE